MIAPEALSLDDKIVVRRRLQDLASWQEAWRVQEKYLNQQIAAIAGSTKETDLKKNRQGKGTDWTGVAQCKFKRPVVYGNFHMMIPSQQASWASYTPHILWLPFNMDISRKKRWELALNGSR